MKRKVILVLSVVLVLSVLTGCGKTVDITNKNVAHIIESGKVESVNLYYDTSINMGRSLEDSLFTDIVYAASSSAKDTFFDAVYNFYDVAKKDNPISFDSINAYISNPANYINDNTNIIKESLENIQENNIDIIITTLGNKLSEYSNIADSLVNKVLKEGKAIAFIGVDFDTEPLFIIAIGNNENLSKYVKAFKSNPTVKQYSKTEEYQVDTTEKINYQIIANKSGIEGIDYKNIQYVENGDYFYRNTKCEETKGSFEKVNLDYKPLDIDNKDNDIEGTVNFTNNVPEVVTIKDKSNASTYIGVRSLLYDVESDNIGGKIKLNIPFHVIEGVKLSNLDCIIDSKTYYAREGKKFREVDYDNISINIAEGVKELNQGKWRIDDATNSMIFNIVFANACDFPSDDGVLKLDITFNQYDSIESVSQWIQDWDMNKVPNLLNLFNSIYSYHSEENKAQNELTIYVGTGTKSLHRRALMASEN